MKKILILFLLFLASVYPQKMRERIPEGLFPRMFTDILYLPGDTATAVFLTYKIPYSTLVFEKKGDDFSSSYRIDAEVFTENNNFVDRRINDEQVNTKSFEVTNSETVYDDGFMQFNLEPGSYNLVTQFTDLNSGKEMRTRNVSIKTKISSKFFQPLIISRNSECNGSLYRLVNYEGNIPFDGSTYELLIPVKDSESEYNVEVSNNGWKYFTGTLKAEVLGKASLSLCEGNIFVNFTPQNSSVSYVRISPGSQLLEGELTISLMNKKNEVVQNLKTNVKWYDKPHSLRNRETAVKLLKFIDEEETYKYITDADEQKFDSLFFNYWKQYDPTPDDSYNELMDEYYKRADYAAMNFSSISGKPGLESDRGKIYIKFGKPVNIERTSNENGKMIEIWEYANQKKFSFIDEKGTGEFNLMNG